MIPWNEIFTRDSRFFDRGRKREEKICRVVLEKKEKRGEKFNFLRRKKRIVSRQIYKISSRRETLLSRKSQSFSIDRNLSPFFPRSRSLKTKIESSPRKSNPRYFG